MAEAFKMRIEHQRTGLFMVEAGHKIVQDLSVGRTSGSLGCVLAPPELSG